eukprot:TRINITY_DN77099_c0_g1_i1.p1 TRINITY_DN77099_c0_g1~~TRINITY_DN77099_c0_g1_i1.p1  ORF type:complete len:162 (+),score=31.90 TRINITY_DN77099_c0_g1_i1:44-529(+)
MPEQPIGITGAKHQEDVYLLHELTGYGDAEDYSRLQSANSLLDARVGQHMHTMGIDKFKYRPKPKPKKVEDEDEAWMPSGGTSGVAKTGDAELAFRKLQDNIAKGPKTPEAPAESDANNAMAAQIAMLKEHLAQQAEKKAAADAARKEREAARAALAEQAG